MTSIQQQAIQLIKQLPDEKVMALITLATDEIRLIELKKQEQVERKKKAFKTLEMLDLEIPGDFDADAELYGALEEKYGSIG